MILCPECEAFTGYIDPSCQLCCGNGWITDDIVGKEEWFCPYYVDEKAKYDQCGDCHEEGP